MSISAGTAKQLLSRNRRAGLRPLAVLPIIAFATSLGCGQRPNEIPAPAAPTVQVPPETPGFTLLAHGIDITRQKATDILTVTDEFDVCDGPKGWCYPRDESWAFAKLFNEPDADAAFKLVFEQATDAGKLYALCGLYFTDQAFFKQELEKLLVRNPAVMPFRDGNKLPLSGCGILKSSDPSAVRLDNSSDTLRDWFARNHDLQQQKGAVLDIVGGAYPDILREFAFRVKSTRGL